MKIRVLYFGRLRERLGLDEESIDVPVQVRSLGDLQAWLRDRPGSGSAFQSVSGVRGAIDQRVAPEAALLRDGAEVAFFPPMTGG